MYHNTFRLTICGVLLALMMTACSSSTRVSPLTSLTPGSRRKVSRQLRLYPAQRSGVCLPTMRWLPLDIQRETPERCRGDGDRIQLRQPNGGRVPAILIVPDGAGPFAAGVHARFRRYRWDCAILQEDMPGWARLASQSAPIRRPQHANFNPFTFREKDRREQIQLVVDLRRAIDVLLTIRGRTRSAGIHGD